MKYMKSILIVSAVVLAGLTLSMLAPKAAHAIAATAVQLMNTSANPVLIDEDNVARQGFTIHGSDLHGQCAAITPHSPSGRVFVESVYIDIRGQSGVDAAVQLIYQLNGNEYNLMLPTTQTPQGNLAIVEQPIRLYVSGDAYMKAIPYYSNSGCNLTVVGHLVPAL